MRLTRKRRIARDDVTKAEPQKSDVRFERTGSFTIVNFTCTKINTQNENDRIFDAIAPYIAAPTFQNLLFDFTGVKFVTSCTINMLLVVLKRVKMKGGEVYFCGLAEGVRQVFELMELFKLFKIYPTRDQAVSALESQAV
jgi:anti-anti-sigma factor